MSRRVSKRSIARCAGVDLHVLREAFVRDRDTGAARAFCKSRIAIIDRILREEPCEHTRAELGETDEPES